MTAASTQQPECTAYLIGPNSRRLIPSSRTTALTVPGARSLPPQSGIEAISPVVGLRQIRWLPFPSRSSNPVRATAERGRGNASSPDQSFNSLRAIGQNRSQRWGDVPPEFAPGRYQRVQGFLNIGLDLVRCSSLRHQPWHIRAGDGVDTARIGFKVQPNGMQTHKSASLTLALILPYIKVKEQEAPGTNPFYSCPTHPLSTLYTASAPMSGSSPSGRSFGKSRNGSV
jgi:hypothetical protein